MFDTPQKLREGQRLFESDTRSLYDLVFTDGPVAEGDVRLAAVVLRKWLVDGLLGQLSRSMSAVPTLPAIDNTVCLDELPKQPSVNYFVTGGVKFAGKPIFGIYNSSLPPEDKPLIPADQMTSRFFRLGEFMSQRRIFFEGAYFTTEEIIKFTANKLGGAHYDLNRPGALAHLERASRFMMFGGPLQAGDEPPCALYLVLESKGSEILSGLHIEIIAAATSLLHLHLNGQQVVMFDTSRSIRQRLRDLFKRRSKGRFRFYPYG
jgi:hypothetical protein